MELTTVPRPSKHEQKAREWIIGYTQKWNRVYKEDDYGNIVVFIPPSSEKTKALPSVTIQSHLDMVCEKNMDSTIDFLTDPLVLTLEEKPASNSAGKPASEPASNSAGKPAKDQEQWLTAVGTTLGADNGIAVAMAVELMNPELGIEHGPLELLFTLDEEIGLTGAANLSADMIASPYLINIDNSEEGFFCTGCAGGRDFTSTIPVATSMLPSTAASTAAGTVAGTVGDSYLPYEISVQGLSGGHSGMEIFDGRGNAIKILEWVLSDVQEEVQIFVSSLEGGNKRNAIPHFASARCWVAKQDLEALQKRIDGCRQDIALELPKIDQDFRIELSARDTAQAAQAAHDNSQTAHDNSQAAQDDREVFSKTSLQRILSFIRLCPHGVLYRRGLDSLETTLSNNLASIHTKDAKVCIVNNSRFLSSSADRHISRTIKNLFADDDITNYTENYYEEWKPKTNSKLLAFCTEEYERLFQKKAVVGVVHAGIECAVLNTRVPQSLDMISFGPDIEFLHSPKERVHIASTFRVWDFLKNILAKFSDLEKSAS